MNELQTMMIVHVAEQVLQTTLQINLNLKDIVVAQSEYIANLLINAPKLRIPHELPKKHTVITKQCTRRQHMTCIESHLIAAV